MSVTSQASDPELVDQLLAFFAIVGAAFILGVTYAGYRAIGWAERIREWAAAIADSEPPQVNENVATMTLDGIGEN